MSFLRQFKRQVDRREESRRKARWTRTKKQKIVSLYFDTLTELVSSEGNLEGQLMSDIASNKVKEFVNEELVNILGQDKSSWKAASMMQKQEARSLLLAAKLAGKEITEVFIKRRLEKAKKEKLNNNKEQADIQELAAKYQKNISSTFIDKDAAQILQDGVCDD